MTSVLPAVPAQKTAEIRAVCLDIDDTLIDYGGSVRSVLSAMIGRDDAWPAWQRTTDEHVARVISGECDYDTMRRERTRAFFADLGECLDDAEVDRREQYRLDAMEQSWRVFEDTLPCLDWLRATGIKVAAVTNASGPHQRAKIAAVGLSEFFDEVVIAGELGVAKPDPAIFRTACLDLGVDLAETVHVGDRLDLDAIGARDAGMHGVWLNRTGESGPAPSGVSTISSLAELPELIVCELSGGVC
ncbi:putative hydrolase of the HAD superfamily [Kutzneria viridogrisea]|uniref:Hydrolase of the HAD superfamily n=1 Tax=Kutzneria viridogrisea TaxID=47990 RepID=A0ABR6BGM5_9PSEU|nr:putative hydrolase of the HAD superfamily [Kutzneria viridogrisea]